jgi:acetyl esterase
MSRTFLALALLSIGVASGRGVMFGDPVPRNTDETTSEQGVATSETCSFSEPPAEPKRRKALAPIVEKGLREGIEFAKVGDVSLTLDAFVPEGDGPFPACILVHGGGFIRGDKQTYITPLFEPLSKAGFAWFTIDYRLSPKHRWPACAEDVDAAIRWVKAHAKDYKVDPWRIALIGESAGGHLVSYAGVRATEATRLAAVVPIYAPHDLEFQVRHRNELGESMTALLGLTELNDAAYAKLREVSPSSYVHGGLPPFLLLHGDKDAQVPFEQSPRFQKQMRAEGNTCDLITIPDGAHGMGQWDERLPGWKDQLVDWLKKTLK